MAYNIKVDPDKLDNFSDFVDGFVPRISDACTSLKSSASALGNVTDAESMSDVLSSVAKITSILEGVEPDLRQLSSGVKNYAQGVRNARAAMG